jgi:hypothetical protein
VSQHFAENFSNSPFPVLPVVAEVPINRRADRVEEVRFLTKASSSEFRPQIKSPKHNHFFHYVPDGIPHIV